MSAPNDNTPSKGESNELREQLKAAEYRLSLLTENRSYASVRERAVWLHERGEHSGDLPFEHCAMCERDSLRAALDHMTESAGDDSCAGYERRAVEAEAKLAKAVGALRNLLHAVEHWSADDTRHAAAVEDGHAAIREVGS